jgi:hypothetical protein
LSVPINAGDDAWPLFADEGLVLVDEDVPPLVEQPASTPARVTAIPQIVALPDVRIAAS